MRHYDNTAWMDYLEEKTSQLERSLMEEHILHCDKCMEEYINALETQSIMNVAPDELVDNVMAVIKKNSSTVVYKGNYKTHARAFLRYAAAASIALLLWKFGIFTGLSDSITKADISYKNDSVGKVSLNSGFGDELVNGINNMFDFITVKGENLFYEKKK